MNQSQTLQKLVNLLGHSENDPEVESALTQLGVRFPLKKPKKSFPTLLFHRI